MIRSVERVVGMMMMKIMGDVVKVVKTAMRKRYDDGTMPAIIIRDTVFLSKLRDRVVNCLMLMGYQ